MVNRTRGLRMKRLEKKHPLAIRWCHWLNFPLLSIMLWSGALIYWAHDVYVPVPEALADLWHFLLAVGYVAFFGVHIAKVIRTVWNNFRAMVTGYEVVKEEGALS